MKIEQLYDKYPELLPEAIGIGVGEGWVTILDALCICITGEIKYGKMEEPVKIVQIKEKFGELRFYIDGGNDRIHAYINMAEAMSYRMCEKCGSTDDVQLTKTNWRKNWCARCRG